MEVAAEAAAEITAGIAPVRSMDAGAGSGLRTRLVVLAVLLEDSHLIGLVEGLPLGVRQAHGLRGSGRDVAGRLGPSGLVRDVGHAAVGVHLRPLAVGLEEEEAGGLVLGGIGVRGIPLLGVVVHAVGIPGAVVPAV